MKLGSLLTGVSLMLCLILGAFQDGYSQNEKKPVGELLYKIVQTDGIDAAIARYRELKKDKSTTYDLGPQQLNALGYRLLGEYNYSAAIEFFKLNTEMYPDNFNVWDSLAEGYLNSGKQEMAVKYYRKALDMLEADTTLPANQKNFFRNNAELKLYEAEHFDHPMESSIHYVSYYGGVPAGKWDMKNLADFKKSSNEYVSYAGNNLYFRPVPNNVEETFSSRYPADVSHSFISGDYRRYVKQGEIADITELWNQNSWDEIFLEPFQKLSEVDGKKYFVPMAFQWNPVFYRKDIFDKHGLTPPDSWDELLELVDRLNELGYIPFSIAVQQWPPPVARWFTTLNLRLNGPEFHERVMKGNIPYTDSRIRNVFEHWRELFRRDAFADSSYANTYSKGVQDLTSGKAVMYNLGEWLFESLDEEQGAKLDFFAFPEIKPGLPSAEIVHTYGAFMNANTDNPDQAAELLTYLAGMESQTSNVQENQRVVANTNVNQDLYSDLQKRIIQRIKQTDVLVPLFEMNTHPEFASKALTVFQEFWKNPEDIDGALNKLETARKEVFGE